MNNLAEFTRIVEALLGQFLQARGYRLMSDKANPSTPRIEILFLNSSGRKILVYRSVSEGEVNIMIGGPNASSSDMQPPSWQYLNRLLLEGGRITREQLRAITAGPARGWDAQLEDITRKLTDNFDLIDQMSS